MVYNWPGNEQVKMISIDLIIHTYKISLLACLANYFTPSQDSVSILVKLVFYIFIQVDGEAHDEVHYCWVLHSPGQPPIQQVRVPQIIEGHVGNTMLKGMLGVPGTGSGVFSAGDESSG